MKKLCWFVLAAPLAANVLPTPQIVKSGAASAEFPKSQPITIVIGNASDRQAGIAADLLTRELKGFRIERSTVRPQSGSVIVLWNCATQGMPASASASDRELLRAETHFGQSYLLETGAHEVRIAGSTGIGLLYGTATLVQLLQPTASGVQVPGTVIQDFPSFRYRAASDWVLRAELNRWAYDWGDGQRAYIERIRRKLDFCLRFKINMVVFDGFGWSVDRRPGYAAMMRELNAYARERGIKLMFSGFGANFDPAKVEPEFHIGRVILNRRSYPDGPVYPCFGEDRTPEHPTYGTCRSNDALQREIARDIQAFVRAVEPGALYVHHEDTGHYTSTQGRWAHRCQECMRRWPNPDFAAADGGAGAMARGYGNILDAVNRVRNDDSGYDAARDCTVVFISPPYGVDSNRSGMGSGNVDPWLNWNKTLEFWTNVLAAMPAAPNMEVGFREIFAGPEGRQWMDVYRQRMLSRRLNPNVFVFFLGGADQYSNGSFNYPFTGSAVMNGLFDGAESIYNFNGGLHQEAQQVINAQYAWNSSAPGRLTPTSFDEGVKHWRALMKNDDLPPAIFASDGVFETACARVYGDRAGKAMARLQSFYEDRQTGELPEFYPARVYTLAVLWRLLQGDSNYWNREPSAIERRALESMHVSRTELHRRLAKFWRQSDAVNQRGTRMLEEVFNAGDLRPDAVEDVEQLRVCLAAGSRIAELVAAYHDWLADPAADRTDVLRRYASLSRWLRDNVHTDFADPKGGDRSSWFEAAESIRSNLLAEK
jgi:hypothetical protein